MGIKLKEMTEAERKDYLRQRGMKAAQAKWAKEKLPSTKLPSAGTVEEISAELKKNVTTTDLDIAKTMDGITAALISVKEKIRKEVLQEIEKDVLVPRKINNWTYIPPKVLIKRLIRHYRKGYHVLLNGPTGGGKTTLILETAKYLKRKVIRVNLNGQATSADLIGFWYLDKNKSMQWINGALPTAMIEGHILLVDELDAGSAEMLSRFNAVTEPSSSLTLIEKGNEVIIPHPDFRIFATSNTLGNQAEYKYLYPGTNVQNSAFISRFAMETVDWPSEQQEQKILIANFPNVVMDDIVLMSSLAQLFRASFLKGEIDFPVSPREIYAVAEWVNDGKSVFKAFEYVFKPRIVKSQYAILLGIVKRICPNPTERDIVTEMPPVT